MLRRQIILGTNKRERGYLVSLSLDLKKNDFCHCNFFLKRIGGDTLARSCYSFGVMIKFFSANVRYIMRILI